MYTAVVYSDTSEQFVLRRHDGFHGGKPLLAFLQIFQAYLLDIKKKDNLDEVLKWFSRLDSNSETPLKSLAQPLFQSHYIGGYNFSEYAILAEKETSTEKRDLWKQMFTECMECWTAIEFLLNSVKELYKLLSVENLEPTFWFEPADTLPDFLALIETLELAQQRGARKVMIQFR